MHADIMKLKCKQTEETKHLRIKLRHETLSQEVENTSNEMQQLRPMKGEKLVANNTSFVRNGTNPAAGLIQVRKQELILSCPAWKGLK